MFTRILMLDATLGSYDVASDSASVLDSFA